MTARIESTYQFLLQNAAKLNEHPVHLMRDMVGILITREEAEEIKSMLIDRQHEHGWRVCAPHPY